MNQKENNKIGVAYCRVSTDEQATNGLSLDVQEQKCTEKLQEDGYTTLKPIRDEGISAGSMKRKGIQQIIGMVVRQEIQAVCTIDSSRISRNTYEYLYFRDLLRKHKVTLIYLNNPNMDDSAMSRGMDTIVAATNEIQRLITSEKVKATLNERARAGFFPAAAPIGYANIENPDKSVNRMALKVIAPNESAPLVTESFKLYATGNYNARDLWAIMCAKGLRNRNGTKLSPSRFYDMLKNRIYLGEISWGEIRNKNGLHRPLIDLGTFNQVQSVMAGHNLHASRKRKHSWLLSGFIYCANHAKRFTAEWHLNKKIAYYHCTNREGCGKYIETNKLEAQIAEKFKEIEFSPDFIETIIGSLQKTFYERTNEYESKRQGLVNRRKALEAKRKVAEEKLFAGTLDDASFTRIRNEIKEEIDSLQTQIFDLEDKREAKIDIAQEILRFTRSAYHGYVKAQPSVKRHYLSLFGRNLKLRMEL